MERRGGLVPSRPEEIESLPQRASARAARWPSSSFDAALHLQGLPLLQLSLCQPVTTVIGAISTSINALPHFRTQPSDWSRRRPRCAGAGARVGVDARARMEAGACTIDAREHQRRRMEALLTQAAMLGRHVGIIHLATLLATEVLAYGVVLVSPEPAGWMATTPPGTRTFSR